MLKLKSPAKVNLFLRVAGRRPDDYHDLASLFQTVDLYDTLKLTLAESDSLTCKDLSIPVDHTNLILKAADLFRQKTGIDVKVHVDLDKQIPPQSGLGGGSSNAATTLWALNQLCDQPATTEELMRWSGEIGSDIPFFFSQGTAYCTGRGEKVEPRPLKAVKGWIVKPPQGLCTAKVFQNLKIRKRDQTQEYFNDLEQSAFEILPELAEIKKNLLKSGFNTVVMTGSGSAFFCLGERTGLPFYTRSFVKKTSRILRVASRSELPGLTFYPVTFINRKANAWYTDLT